MKFREPFDPTTYIQSILTYAGAAWVPFICKSTWRRIEAVQTIGIRTIVGQPSIVKNSVLLNTAGFRTIREIIKKNSAAMFYRISTSQYNHIKSIGRISPPPHVLSKHTTTP